MERSEWIDIKGFEYSSQYFTPQEPPWQLLLAKAYCEWVSASDVLAWTSLANYPVNEDTHSAVLDFRRQMGELRDIWDAPAFVASTKILSDSLALYIHTLQLMAYTWEGWLVSEDGSRIVRIGDDISGWCTNDIDAHNSLLEVADRLQLNFASSYHWDEL
jgi:hypothetical protein